MPTVEGFVNRYAFTMTVESLGQIRVWKIEGSTLIWAIRRNFETRQHIDGYPFMKVLLSTCAAHVNPENERTKGEPITVKEAERLSSEEAEQIAEEIIKRHEYLFEDRNKPILTERPGRDGTEATVEISKERLEVPRKQEESASEYLYRLVLGLSEREEIEKKAVIEDMSKVAKNFGSLTSGFVDSLKMPNYAIAPPRNPQHTTNEILNDVLENLVRQREFNEVSAKSVQGTATSVERIEKRVESWETKFHESATKAGKQGRTNIWIQVAIGLLALLALVLAYKSYQVSLRNQSQSQVTIPASAENPQEETK